MFKLFKKKTEADKLNKKYQQLMEESYKLSTTNRSLSDQKAQEANEVLQQLELLDK